MKHGQQHRPEGRPPQVRLGHTQVGQAERGQVFGEHPPPEGDVTGHTGIIPGIVDEQPVEGGLVEGVPVAQGKGCHQH